MEPTWPRGTAHMLAAFPSLATWTNPKPSPVGSGWLIVNATTTHLTLHFITFGHFFLMAHVPPGAVPEVIALLKNKGWSHKTQLDGRACFCMLLKVVVLHNYSAAIKVFSKKLCAVNFSGRSCCLLINYQYPHVAVRTTSAEWRSRYGWNNVSGQSSWIWPFWLWENREAMIWRIISKLNFRINCGGSAKTTPLMLSESLCLPNESFLLLLSNVCICTVLMFSVGHLIIGFHWLKKHICTCLQPHSPLVHVAWAPLGSKQQKEHMPRNNMWIISLRRRSRSELRGRMEIIQASSVRFFSPTIFILL